MPESWRSKVQEERGALEDLADSDLPCANIAEMLLKAADEEREVAAA